MIAMLGSGTALGAILLAGMAAFLAVMVFYPGLAGGGAIKKRVKNITDRREALRKQHKVDKKGEKKRRGELDEGTVRLMRNTVEKFRMEELLNNTELKLKLNQAGKRSQKAPTVFLFFKAVMPVIAFIATLAYYSLIYAGTFETARHSLIAVMVAAVAYALPSVWLKNATQKRQTLMARAFPDALDLMVICVESGMSVERSFQWVSEEIAVQSQDLAEEIALTCAELSYLGDRSKAYENLAHRTGLQQVKALVGTLVQAERYGTPVGSALRVLSDESRGERMSVAERKAAALPAKLTVPMIVFFLPVLFIVIIGPAFLQFQS